MSSWDQLLDFLVPFRFDDADAAFAMLTHSFNLPDLILFKRAASENCTVKQRCFISTMTAGMACFVATQFPPIKAEIWMDNLTSHP
jgi:hypothetical protein